MTENTPGHQNKKLPESDATEWPDWPEPAEWPELQSDQERLGELWRNANGDAGDDYPVPPGWPGENPTAPLPTDDAPPRPDATDKHQSP